MRTLETGKEVDVLPPPKTSLDGLEKAVRECEPELPKPATELPLPKAGAAGAPKGPADTEVGNPESPGDPKVEAEVLLNENEAAEVISGFPNPKFGVEVELAELVEGTAPNAGGAPNTEVLPAGAVKIPPFVLKLKF